jgi:hypothetical protein
MNKSVAIAAALACCVVALPAFAQSSSSIVTPSPSIVVTPSTSIQTVTTTTGAASDAAKPKDDKKE